MSGDPLPASAALRTAISLVRKSGFALTAAELAKLEVNDFGLGNFAAEGMVFFDILRSPRVRITMIVLLPHQTLPEHMHPSYGDEPGKEETLRCLWGETKVVLPGEPTPGLSVPTGKEHLYTVRHAVTVPPAEQYTIAPRTFHWFQAGPEGSVNLTFQNRVDETRNVFTDDGSSGCPIKLTDP